MDMTLKYLGHSGLQTSGSHRMLKLMPNLAREAVSFDAALLKPLRFREAISTLHDVVINDLRFHPRDKTAYNEWKAEQQQRTEQQRRNEYARAKEQILAQRDTPVPPDLEVRYRRDLRRYWRLRQSYSNHLWRQDQSLWRMLMPCDPVITVADDVLLFECFSADESSYGCLSVDRDACFGRSEQLQLGTTNVDYSWALYDHFQTLRTYRETRFQVDPMGFEVAVQGRDDYREEKIDLPPAWLRGFMQIQSAMTLPMLKVPLSREAVYSLLAWLKRHKAKTSPRALRFELEPGRPPQIVLEPWKERIVSHGTTYEGPPREPIRVWGRRRLLVLARMLPIMERCDVHLLGTGLPSFWMAQAGEMRLTLGLSGWTTNDWTRTSSLDLLGPPIQAGSDQIQRVSQFMSQRRAGTADEVARQCLLKAPVCAAALNHLANSGQLIFDLAAGVYRWRQIMPQALGEAELGPENPETAGCRQLIRQGGITLQSSPDPSGGVRYVGTVQSTSAEVLLDDDGRIRQGKCTCSHHHRFGIRQGPCRHLLALRQQALQQQPVTDLANWYERLIGWTQN